MVQAHCSALCSQTRLTAESKLQLLDHRVLPHRATQHSSQLPNCQKLHISQSRAAIQGAFGGFQVMQGAQHDAASWPILTQATRDHLHPQTLWSTHYRSSVHLEDGTYLT